MSNRTSDVAANASEEKDEQRPEKKHWTSLSKLPRSFVIGWDDAGKVREKFLRNYCKTPLLELRARFQLRTDPEWLANWLRDYLERETKTDVVVIDYSPLSRFISSESMNPINIPRNKQWHYVQLISSPPVTIASGVLILKVEGFLRGPSDLYEKLGFTPISFELRRGLGNQTTVTVSVMNFHALIHDFLEKLLVAIADRWPEALELLQTEPRSVSDRLYEVDDRTWTTWNQAVDSLRAELGVSEPNELQPTKPTSEIAATSKDVVPDPAPEVPMKQPRVPTKEAYRRIWKLRWNRVKGRLQYGDSYKEILEWLEKTNPNLSCSIDTLRDNIAAGEAGMLDD